MKTQRRFSFRCWALGLAGGTLAATVAIAGVPPTPWINYQGVLRDAMGNPLDGNYAMTFGLYDSAVAGQLILTDVHTTVVVNGGLFAAWLGAGTVLDGPGPGTYTSLPDVFSDYSDIYLGIEVEGESLEPRVRVLSVPYALNAGGLAGESADFYLDTSSAAQAKQGPLSVGTLSVEGWANIEASGGSSAALEMRSPDGGTPYVDFSNDATTDHDMRLILADDHTLELNGGGLVTRTVETTVDSGYGSLGVGNFGVVGYGNHAGGVFENLVGDSYAHLGREDYGIRAYGQKAGGTFNDLEGSGGARVGVGDMGIEAQGEVAGGYFLNPDRGSWAYLGHGAIGVEGHGGDEGAHFTSPSTAGFFESDERGIAAHGTTAAGFFTNTEYMATAYLARRDVPYTGLAKGISAYGDSAGGYFWDVDGTGKAWVGYGGRGIWAKGTFAGGTFSHPDNVTFWADVATPTHKIRGTGDVQFVQNHPHDRDKVVVYTAPEGDETAVYTRGTGRLVGGEARIELGETFAWVTNPDIGLTVHLTPRGNCRGLYADSVSTQELRIRELDGGTSDAVFDYIVFGLRIGFEEQSRVEPKLREAPLPSRESTEQLYAEHPELRRHNSLERFKRMTARVRGASSDVLDSSAAATLRQAIDAAGGQQLGRVDPNADRALPEQLERRDMPADDGESGPVARVAEATEASPSAGVAADRRGIAEQPASGESLRLFPVSEVVAPGDLLTVDLERPGHVRRAVLQEDPAVVGFAAAEPSELDGTLHVPVVSFGFREVNADATYGAIRPGNLLVASPTPGHVMLAIAATDGTVVAKAIEPLDTGTGTIRVVVMLR